MFAVSAICIMGGLYLFAKCPDYIMRILLVVTSTIGGYKLNTSDVLSIIAIVMSVMCFFSDDI